MGATLLEKIFKNHGDRAVVPGDIVDMRVDARIARDFGGANVVGHLKRHSLSIEDPKRTHFTFDCNPGGSDQSYATNQQTCRTFAREHGMGLFDIDRGIGTHLAIDNGLAFPGSTLVSTDSHANLVGAIGAFGQGMGDVDIAHAFSKGRVWFKVPPTVQIVLRGNPSPQATAKDIVLALLRNLGASGLLGFAAEIHGDIVAELSVADRITIASMATEMGGIIALFPPNQAVTDYCRARGANTFEPVLPDKDANYAKTIDVALDNLGPLIARPGHPDDVTEVRAVMGTKIDSVFIGSCTNGRLEDIKAAADILEGKRVAPGVVLKVVPSTNDVWNECLRSGVLETLKRAGALVGNAGCAGCAAGQIGQNGPGEVTVSTGNRNFAGKQGKGDVYLASPAVAAASAIAGAIALPTEIPDKPAVFVATRPQAPQQDADLPTTSDNRYNKPVTLQGRVWIIAEDNVDTDMIYHNKHLTVTDLTEMGQYTFGNLEGWQDFPNQARAGDIVVLGKNFGAGSSRQQAVDCFKSLGISLLVAQSFGAIYERNAINAGFPILMADLVNAGLSNGDVIDVALETGTIKLPQGTIVQGQPFASVQMEIYQRGGLLNPAHS